MNNTAPPETRKADRARVYHTASHSLRKALSALLHIPELADDHDWRVDLDSQSFDDGAKHFCLFLPPPPLLEDAMFLLPFVCLLLFLLFPTELRK